MQKLTQSTKYDPELRQSAAGSQVKRLNPTRQWKNRKQ